MEEIATLAYGEMMVVIESLLIKVFGIAILYSLPFHMAHVPLG
jgi:hypothetical protein